MTDTPSDPVTSKVTDTQQPEPPDYYDYADDLDDEDEDDIGEDCGQLPDGTCLLAGTEYCDWECPYGD